MKKITLSGGFLVFLGAAFWSLNSPLVKYLSLDPVLICALRSVIAGIALAATIRPKQLSWNGWTLVYVVSYTGLCMSIILALGATSAPVAIGMQYTATIWLFLVGLLRTHRFRFKSFLPVLVIFIGVVFFMCSGSDAASQKGNLIALTEGVFFALMTISSKKVAGKKPRWSQRRGKSVCRRSHLSLCAGHRGQDERHDRAGLGHHAGAGRGAERRGLCLL